MNLKEGKIKKVFLIASWALYDLANQFFTLNVVSLYLPRWLTIEKNAPEIFYSLSFGISMALIALCSPFLGIISDIRGRPKAFLTFFTLLSVSFTIFLGFAPNIFWGLVFFACANFGFQGAIIFYNVLLTKVAPEGKVGFVSGFGRMFGYSGAIVALYLTKPVVLRFGYQPVFLLTGILFLFFSLPCLIFIRDDREGERRGLRYFLNKERCVQIYQRFKVTIFESYRLVDFRNFLKAAFFILCVVNVIILFMSVYVSKALGLNEAAIINLIAFSTLFAMGGSIVSGFLCDMVGCQRSVIGVLFLWGLSILAGTFLAQPFHWIIGALAGISLGSTWTVFRVVVIKLVPQQKVGEAFGLFNLVAYTAGIVGPLFWGGVLLVLPSMGSLEYRIALLSLVVFIAIGIIFPFRIAEKNEQG